MKPAPYDIFDIKKRGHFNWQKMYKPVYMYVKSCISMWTCYNVHSPGSKRLDNSKALALLGGFVTPEMRVICKKLFKILTFTAQSSLKQ